MLADVLCDVLAEQSAVDMAEVLADDALIESVRSGDPMRTDDALSCLLTVWRESYR